MNDQIIRQLKRLKAIEPNPGFTASSRRMILALEKEPAFVWSNFRLAGALAGLVAVVAASVFLFSGQSATTAFASPEMLNQEFNNMNVNIELREISYRQNVSQTISSAISEISTNKLSHLNQDVLNSESNGFDLETSNTDPEIDQLLNKLIQ